jgi:hypothetical protein
VPGERDTFYPILGGAELLAVSVSLAAAHSSCGQINGATVMGIGMTMLEETTFDSAFGRIANAAFGTRRPRRSLN